jgi:hypothetical protein
MRFRTLKKPQQGCYFIFGEKPFLFLRVIEQSFSIFSLYTY